MDPKQKMITALVCAALIAAAILGGAYLLRPKQAPAPYTDYNQQAKIACLQGGGNWVDRPGHIAGICVQPVPVP